jgi:hypothetical protein
MVMGGAWMGGTHEGIDDIDAPPSPPFNMVAETRHILEEVGLKHYLPVHGNSC